MCTNGKSDTVDVIFPCNWLCQVLRVNLWHDFKYSIQSTHWNNPLLFMHGQLSPFYAVDIMWGVQNLIWFWSHPTCRIISSNIVKIDVSQIIRQDSNKAILLYLLFMNIRPHTLKNSENINELMILYKIQSCYLNQIANIDKYVLRQCTIFNFVYVYSTTPPIKSCVPTP